MPFTAQYAGVCETCDGPIKPGHEIQDAHHGYEHVKCPVPPPDLTSGSACPKCFLIHNGECF